MKITMSITKKSMKTKTMLKKSMSTKKVTALEPPTPHGCQRLCAAAL